ncbi:hypothetical protein K458DRAFT_8179 [Lentithecium fluviatile CBS 122367]|uniref:Uncharacterized protein n=1 Tax=Lentithecium fluviatile CBS 122367 TaxID=1168545 RepID=A0A6G1JN90_9PLEO|nr:hypothetical protein K458DRAFT_8179 [Lentithecium fluviatile CBS 122367]
MPPFPHTLLSLPTTPSSQSHPITPARLHRRWSSCSYYDTSCSTHRTILLAIIIAVCILTFLILTLLFVRHHKRRALKRRVNQAQQQVNARQQAQYYIPAPVPNASTVNKEYVSGPDGALRGGDLVILPPAYTR